MSRRGLKPLAVGCAVLLIMAAIVITHQ